MAADFSKLTFRVSNGLDRYQDRQFDVDPNGLQRLSAKKTLSNFAVVEIKYIYNPTFNCVRAVEYTRLKFSV